MKTAEEKLQYKTHFFKLGQGRIIDLDDPVYWQYFWQEPETANDIFELLTPFDLRTIVEQNRSNYLLLVYQLIQKIVDTAEATSSSNEKPTGKYSSKLSSRELVNCIRLLTKLLPFLLELSDYLTIETKFWLASHYDPLNFVDGVIRPPHKVDTQNLLAVRLLKAIVTLMFSKDFTVLGSRNKSDTKQLSVWEPGIGVTSKYQVPDLILEANRTSLLKLLLTLCGVSLYQLPSQIVSNGSLFLTLLVASLPRIEVLTLVCSLINVLCRSVRPSALDNMLQFNDPTIKYARYSYVTYCIQLLTLMVVYPLPKDSPFLKQYSLVPDNVKPYNMARLYLGKLHKDNEILFLSSSLINHLRSAINPNGTPNGYSNNQDLDQPNFFNKLNYYGGGGGASPIWATEVIMLLWELFQCNMKLRDIAGRRFYSELCFLLTFHIKQFYNNHRDKNLVRVASYFLLYLSHNECFHDQLLEVSSELMPYNNNIQSSTRDFLVIQLCHILSAHASSKPNLTINPLLATTLVEILYNIIPLVSSKPSQGTNDPTKKLNNINPRNGISYSASTALTNLLVRFSDREFLLKASFNQDLLALLIRSVCTAALRDPNASRMLLFSILKGEKNYDQIWNSIHSLDNEYFNGDTLVLKSIEDQEENGSDSNDNDNNPSTASSIHRDSITGNNTPNPNFYKGPKQNASLNGSFTSLTISEQNNENGNDNGFSNNRKSVDGNESITSANEPNLRSSIDEYEAENEAIDKALRPHPPTGMTPKAREKQKMGTPINKAWGGNDALRVILTILIPYLKLTLNEIWSGQNGSSIDAFELAKHIGNANFDQLLKDNCRQINYDFLPSSALVQLKFSWSRVSLGWYLSLLYGDIFNALDNINNLVGAKNKILKNLTSSVMSIGKFFNSDPKTSDESIISNLETHGMVEEIQKSITTINHWHQTYVKLFKIEVETSSFFDVLNSKLISSQPQAAPKTPSMERPNTLSRRLSDLRINQQRMGSVPSSGLSTPKEEPEAYFPRVNSVGSLQSLNAINRSRTATPRNSISM